jgi:hypothetical protein
MARPERFELPASWFVARRSIQLSYGRTLPRVWGREYYHRDCRSFQINTLEQGHGRPVGRPRQTLGTTVAEPPVSSLPEINSLRKSGADRPICSLKPRGGEGGIVRGCAAHPSLPLGTAVAKALRRPAPPLPRRLVEPWGSNPALAHTYKSEEEGRGTLLFAFIYWRRGRDSNPRRAFDPYALSRGAPSTTRPPLRLDQCGLSRSAGSYPSGAV